MLSLVAALPCSGACGKKCPTDPNAITICNLGTCLFTCTGGLTQCGTALAPTCVDTTSDNANCGATPVRACEMWAIACEMRDIDIARFCAAFAGSCGFVCQQSFSCVSSVCTNVNAG